MNLEWANLNKSMQNLIKKEETYKEGINTLLKLRKSLMDEIILFKEELRSEDFTAIPFINTSGYHNKTIAYSLWHIFRIEDIVTHSLILDDGQIFFRGNYKERINSSIITTGNELVKEEIAEFSKMLDLDELYNYIFEVKESTDKLLNNLSYKDLKIKFNNEKKEDIKRLEVVSKDEEAIWLIDYWCNKDVKGLIKMPLSRHWIMHIEACLKIKNKVIKLKYK